VQVYNITLLCRQSKVIGSLSKSPASQHHRPTPVWQSSVTPLPCLSSCYIITISSAYRIFCPLHRISISRVDPARRFSTVPLQRALAPLEVVLVPYCTSIITALYRGVFFQPLAVEFAPSQQMSIICLDIGSLSHTAH